VLPVTRIAPLPDLIISGATSRARYKRPMTFTRKFRSSICGSISRNVSPSPSPSIMDQHIRGSIRVSNVRDGVSDLAFTRDVANDRAGVGQFLL